MTNMEIVVIATSAATYPIVWSVQHWRNWVPAPARRWRNESGLTDAQLDVCWFRAQERIATENIDLNAARMVGPNARMVGPNTRARTLSPHNLLVLAVAPVDAKGNIRYPYSLTMKLCAGYTVAGDSKWPGIHFSKTFINAEDMTQNDGSIGYEMENVMLEILGCNVDGR